MVRKQVNIKERTLVEMNVARAKIILKDPDRKYFDDDVIYECCKTYNKENSETDILRKREQELLKRYHKELPSIISIPYSSTFVEGGDSTGIQPPSVSPPVSSDNVEFPQEVKGEIK